MAKKLTNPSSKVIATYEMLKSGKPVKVETLTSQLGCKPGSVMIHICQMRGHFGAEIDTNRDGRRVVSYTLTNPSDVAPYMVGKVKAAKAPKAAKVATVKVKNTVARTAKNSSAVPTIDSDFDVSEVSDAELADLKNQLGLA